MREVTAEKVIYSFSREHEAALVVQPGETLNIATFDCFSNQLRCASDRLEALDWDRINPATGPLFVEGAEKGDVLKVTIHDIELNEKGTIVTGKDMGVLGGLLEETQTKIIPVEKGKAIFSEDIHIPIQPMVGVIGVAPAGDAVNTGTPGAHGGNMDNTMVAPGASLYFNVETEGALFGLGDVHAVMGDGEIGVSGLEIPAVVQVTLEVIKNKTIRTPMLENADAWSVIYSAETVDEAANQATIEMFHFLKGQVDLHENEIVMLMSLVGQLEFCQVVDPLKTVRFVMPKAYLDSVAFK